MPSLPTLEAFYKVEESNVNRRVHAFHLEHAGLITSDRAHTWAENNHRKRTNWPNSSLMTASKIPFGPSEDSWVRSGNIKSRRCRLRLRNSQPSR